MIRIARWTLGLLLVALGCMSIAACGLLFAFLATFNALTRETVVAEIIMSPIQSDNNGEYIEVVYTPYELKSAASEVLNRTDANSPQSLVRGTSQNFRLYGDTVAVRGPLIKLRSVLQILGYQNIYKLAVIEGEYRKNVDDKLEGSDASLNGGFDAYWWDVNNNEASPPFSYVVDRVTFSGDEEPGFYGNYKKRYHIVVTMDTITWNYMGDVTP
jgi:hypothetical protein